MLISSKHVVLATTLVAAACFQMGCASDDSPRRDRASMAKKALSNDRTSVDKITADWGERPRLAVNAMTAKYGPPTDVTENAIVWQNPGLFKRIMVTKVEYPHNFPKPHMDFLEHTISYNVPQEKVGDLIAFDGSSTINRTAGELSARCDLEGHNILTLNLDHDIVTGKKTVEEARKSFGQNVSDDQAGKFPPYVEMLQFEPTQSNARFPDVPVMPGSPKRVADATGVDAKPLKSMKSAKPDDAEILAFLIAADDNVILPASVAQKRKVSPNVLSYAKMLHTGHGKNQADVMALAQKIDVVPTDTAAVDQLRVNGAGELAEMVQLDGPAFDKAYIAGMIKGHEKTLAMIDSQLSPAVSNPELRKQIATTRDHVAMHLQEAKKIQAGMMK